MTYCILLIIFERIFFYVHKMSIANKWCLTHVNISFGRRHFLQLSKLYYLFRDSSWNVSIQTTFSIHEIIYKSSRNMIVHLKWWQLWCGIFVLVRHQGLDVFTTNKKLFTIIYPIDIIGTFLDCLKIHKM